ncbi:hypothetical protein H4R21_002891, partial [Coemansia helicoidea]
MEDHINVAIRVRPLNQRELRSTAAAQTSLPWLVQRDTITQRTHADGRAATGNSFTFDRVFDQAESTRSVYDNVVKSIIGSSMGGFNGTIFAYGQTSSGKTHTMHGSSSEPGIIKQAVEEMFDIVARDTSREYLVRVSFLEIYNEVLRDLLEPTRTNLKIHETAKREIFVGDLSEHIVFNPAQVEEILLKGDRNRHIAGTNMNERSSRSHTIFRMVIESREKIADGAGEDGEPGSKRQQQQQRLSTSSLASTDEFTGAVMVSCLNLVDLAGSERVGHTGAEGQRLKEGAHINKSLLALGSVIARLSEDGGDRGHIPYRDSKLTRILQPSLGGNARTLIICTITPSADYIDEALSTLKFASRAKTICNTPEVNEELRGDALLRRLKRASELEKEVAQMREIERKKIKIEADNEALLRQLWKSQKERERLQHELALQQRKVFLPVAAGADGVGGTRRQTWFPGLQAPLADGAPGDAEPMDTDGAANDGGGPDEPGAMAGLYRTAMGQVAELKAQNEALQKQHSQTDRRGRDTQIALERLVREHDLLLATLSQLAEAEAVPPSPARGPADTASPRELALIRRKIRALMRTIEASQKQCQKFRAQRPEAEFLELELQAARETLAQREHELSEATRESEAVLVRLRDAESACAAAEQAGQDLRRELAAGLAAEREAGAAASRQQQEAEALRQQLVRRAEDSERETCAAQAAGDQARARCDELMAQLQAASGKADALAHECRELADAKAQIEASGLQAEADLRAELAVRQAGEERLQGDVAALQAQLAAAQAQAAASLEAAMREAREQLDTAQAEHADDASRLGAERQALVEQHRQANEDSARLSAELASLRAEAAAAAGVSAADVAAARGELSAAQQERQRVQTRVEQLAAENADVWERLSELSAANGDLSAKITCGEELEAAQVSRIAALESDLDAADAARLEAAAETDRAIEQHQRSLDAAEAALATLRVDTDVRLAGLQETIDGLERAASASERELAEQQQQRATECERAAQLEADLEAER